MNFLEKKKKKKIYKEKEQDVENEGDIQKIMKDKKMKVNFKINGSHKGGKTLYRDSSGLLKNNKQFNSSNEIISNLKRPNIGNNLIKIYEGITVSYAKRNNNDDILNLFSNFGLSEKIVYERYGHYFKNDNSIFPFIPFAKDSEGVISIMVYYGRGGCGDIVIDCGFTKCFIEMEEEGTFRYIRNLSAITSRCDVLLKNGKNPKLWKPKAINYKLNLSNNYFWKDFERKIYIIDVDSPLSEKDKKSIYNKIKEELYSHYNNLIYFINNGGKKRIDIEDILQKEIEIETNNQTNSRKMAYEIIEECNQIFKQNYCIYIFYDGISLKNDNKVVDYILQCKQITDIKKSIQMVSNTKILISKEFIVNTLKSLKNIKNFNDYSNNYKNIRNSLFLFHYYYENSLKISNNNIISEIERIQKEIEEEIGKDENKLIKFKETMEILSYYSKIRFISASNSNKNNNAAAFKGS